MLSTVMRIFTSQSFENLIAKLLHRSPRYFVLALDQDRVELVSRVSQSYEDYVLNQKKKTARRLAKKSTNPWASEKVIKVIVEFLNSRLIHPINGICMGVRTGHEVLWFRQYLGVDSVLGTDIEPSAEKAGIIECWDFNIVNPAWVGRYKFIYSNSHDHCFDIRQTLLVWLSYLSSDGVLLLEHSRSHGKKYLSNIDLCGVETELLPMLILELTDSEYCVQKMLQVGSPDHVVFVIGRSG